MDYGKKAPNPPFLMKGTEETIAKKT